MLKYGDSRNVEKTLSERLKIFINEGDLGAYFWRNNFNEAQKITTEYNRCYISTQTPSRVPTYITTSPSINKAQGSVSLFFQVGLCRGKPANELSKCCREQIIVSGKNSMNKILTRMSNRKLKILPSTRTNNGSIMSNMFSGKIQEIAEEAQILCEIKSLEDDPGKPKLSFFVFKLKKEHFHS